MKPQSVLAVIILFSIVTGCVKPGCDPLNMNAAANLAGSWQVVRDSISNSELVTAPVNTNYVGQAGDYFKFAANGECYTKEGSTDDTLAYKVLSAQSIDLQNFGTATAGGGIQPSAMQLSPQKVVITTQNAITPGGTYFRTVVLSR